MKDGVIIVNVARGCAIDEEGLYDGLISNKIGYAALDVYNTEPYTGKLLSLKNMIFTPHVGSYAKEARIDMEIQAVKNLIKGLKI
jgi:D-3-phosphoglycerate dehydrogenase